MRKLMLLLSVLFFSVNVFSQTSFGLKVGLSVPKLQGGTSEQSKGYKSRFAPTSGVFFTLGLNNRFDLQLEGFYASQGGKKDGMQLIPTGVYANFKTEAILNYFEVPVLIKYKFGGSGLQPYVDGGFYYGFLMDAKTKSSGKSLIYLDKDGNIPLPIPEQDFSATTDIKKDINKTNYGITGGFGLICPIGYGNLQLDFRGEYGLRNIQKDKELNGENNTGCLLITLGYSIKL
jgi:hypothetical protein